jgi:flagellar biosynthesis protein FlhG
MRATVIAVTSGKGGVGKTNMAVNLSVCLASAGRRVVLFDADLGTANADLLCDLQPEFSLAHVVAGRKTIKQVMVEAPGGFALIGGASGLAKMAALSTYERQRLIEQTRLLEASADVIVIDTGAGISPNVLGFVCAADQQLVVTTPEPAAVTDAYALIKAASRQRDGLRPQVVVNMVHSHEESREVFGRISAVCERFLRVSPCLLGGVPNDDAVRRAVYRRSPFVLESPRCPAALSVEAIARRLAGAERAPDGRGWLRRLSTFFGGAATR